MAAMPPTSAAPGPLSGLRVIDCSTVLAGPYCTMVLGDLGADVIKVEPPEGDATRRWGPPWVGSVEDGTRTAAYYLAVNRNKRSIRLDLATPDGAAILRELLADADVFVENLRPASLARLGFDDATLTALNADLVHLAISGYGPDGPAADRPGYDFVIQAVSGLMSITGDPDAEGGHPTKVGVAISDVVTGLFAAIGVLAGLLANGTEKRGIRVRGQRIDVSLLASSLAVLVNQAQNAFVSGQAPGRLGNAHPNIVPYETYAASDGELAVAVGSDRQWPRFCEAIGLPALATDLRFATNGDRVEHHAELWPLLAERFAVRTVAEWGVVLEAAGIPFGPILDIPAAFASPEAVALGMTVPLAHPALGPVTQVGSPLDLARTPAALRTPPPLLGEHTDEILSALGRDGATIARLHADGVV
jgi:crotonobetainyl-CoA:carnitine CoA-transferase CaiB-like acyl-CoA transferase